MASRVVRERIGFVSTCPACARSVVEATVRGGARGPPAMMTFDKAVWSLAPPCDNSHAAQGVRDVSRDSASPSQLHMVPGSVLVDTKVRLHLLRCSGSTMYVGRRLVSATSFDVGRIMGGGHVGTVRGNQARVVVPHRIHCLLPSTPYAPAPSSMYR